MEQGLAREDWHPPRDPSQEMPFWEAWRIRWNASTGASVKATDHEVAQVYKSLELFQNLTDAELEVQLKRQTKDTRFTQVNSGSGRMTAQEAQRRPQLLALWCLAAKRKLGMLPHATQIRAALEMRNGRLVQLAPGEGKTLAIGLAAALYAGAGRPCHVITANDYLAQRDAESMASLLAVGGVSVVSITTETAPEQYAQLYQADVVYATGKQLLADFLRDQILLSGAKDPVRRRLWEMRQESTARRPVTRGLWAAIVDEADNVLIDEATTPLIISTSEDNPMLVEAVLAGKRIFENLTLNEDFEVKTEPVPDIRFTPKGERRIEELTYLLPSFWQFKERAKGMVSLAVMAKYVYLRDRHYLVDEDNKVVIVDEKTGRVMAGRSWSHGIHQAIEAMEGLELSSPPKTIARMTFQIFFMRYHRLSGASGTLQGIEKELWQTYRLPVVKIEPRVPSRLNVEKARVFSDPVQRFEAVIDEVVKAYEAGTPVLVGTRKIADTEALFERLSSLLVPCQVLNAKHHARESEIVERAGEIGAVTISTNMAGRGTDIALGRGVLERGGLRVLMFEPHEAARIEWQLYGRSGRQGSPGTALGFVCLRDELLAKTFGPIYDQIIRYSHYITSHAYLANVMIWLAQTIVQRTAYATRQRLAERERRVERQLSFSE
ncbi:SecA Preprotein translocase subunit SecA (ATPase, RNA helicase) [Burkholderiaceae bacterium]